MTYREYEKTVFEWLLKKHNSENSFTFSTRQVASKGAETNYFIGTEKSGYFGFTLWSIPVAFPGSSSDLINIMFYRNEDKYIFSIQFNQTKKPYNSQNRWALELIRNIKPKLKDLYSDFSESASKAKMETFSVLTKESISNSIEDLLKKLDIELHKVIPIVDNEIHNSTLKHKKFVAHRYTNDEFIIMQNKLNKRLLKYNNGDNNHPISGSITEKNKYTDKNDLNIILYGPPGTGKTYNTINKSLSIIESKEEKEFEKEERKALKERFDKNIKDGRIVFTTFHQSMCYEDFIEGIKPQKPESNADYLKYDIENGVFKRLCEIAKTNYFQESDKTENESDEFDKVYSLFIEDIKKQISNNEEVVFHTHTNFEIHVRNINNNQIVTRGKTANKDSAIIKDKLRLLYYEYKNINDLLNLSNKEKAIRRVIGTCWHSSYLAVLLGFKEFESKKVVQNTVINSNKNYVLIIDEINRGNVSQIFGELITLIEEDKRLGKPEALKVTLPYSKKEFGVPPNLFIIGTMNTADRSVEALDTALRRRFSFVEMPPKPEIIAEEGALKDKGGIVDDIKLVELLKKINTRIEKLLNKDYMIGHSYFISVANISDLKQVFHNKILPLLQEYFYGDYGKIGLVLGSGFVKMKEKDENVFAKIDEYESSELVERPIFIIENVSDMLDDVFKKAIETLMQ